MQHEHQSHQNLNTKNHANMKNALDPRSSNPKDYIPLIVILLFVTLSSIIHGYMIGGGWQIYFSAFMGFFFIYFSLFKIIDLPGFKAGFAEYDIITKRLPAWGYIYPFIEVALGVLYLLGNNSWWLNWLTIIITGINVLSVGLKIARKEKFMCACLGTTLKVPLTTVTLIEYGLMGLMAFTMLFFN